VAIDTDKIDDAVLALLHDGARAWKGHDWEVLNRLHRKGMIDNPVSKAKCVMPTDQGLAESERLFRELRLPAITKSRLGAPDWLVRTPYLPAALGLDYVRF
jgi:hypothetical protein